MSEAEEPTPAPPPSAPRGGGRWLRGLLGALLAFGVATALTYGELWQRGASEQVVYKAWGDLMLEDPRGFRNEFKSRASTIEPLGWAAASRADVIFESWLVSRNARTLATHPQRLFDTEHCAPAEKTLTLGIPMITMGALAIPTWLATGDSILTYNLTLVSLHWVAALAMYWLVASWTGVPAAGIIAGLLYAFHPIRMMYVMHPSVWDSAWTVFALLFAERLFAKGRWRDALGLAASIAFQIGASFYSLLAAVFLTPPFAAWLLLRDRLRHATAPLLRDRLRHATAPLLRDRLRHATALQLVFVGGCAALSAALLLGPYLWSPAAGKLEHAALAFAAPGSYLPGGRIFPGWCLVGLAALGALWPRGGWLRIEGDPRGALLCGALLVAGVAAGPTLPETAAEHLPEGLAALVPDLWAGFAALLPGLGAVRIVERLMQGVLIALCILAGLAAAALIQRSGRFGGLVAAAVLGLAAADTLRIDSLGIEQRFSFEYADIRPDEDALAFFRALEHRGNHGPILEVPVYPQATTPATTPRIQQSLYHGRRTSACFGSYLPPQRARLEALAERLPRPAAVEELVDLGFTTVVFHHPDRGDPLARARLRPDRIKRLYSLHGMTAYSLSADRSRSGRDTPAAE
jgi:hypothetical protein